MSTHTRSLRGTIGWKLASAGLLTALTLSACQFGTTEGDTEDVAPTADTNDDTNDDTPVADDTDTTEGTDGDAVEATAVADDSDATEGPASTDDDTDSDGDGDADGDNDSDSDTDGDTDGDADGDADSGGDSDAAPGEVAAPGSEFEVGDTVTTHVQALEEGEEYYGYATVATTVVAVEEGDKSLFEEAENSEDFAGYTPWFVTVEHEWLTYEGNPNNNMIPTLVGFNESGGQVGTVINRTWSEGIPGCELDLPLEKDVGGTATSCHVFSVPDDEAVGSVGWRGDDWADGGGSAMDNPYYDDPVLWHVP